MNLATLVVLALATFRLTRLIVADLILEGIRARVLGWCYRPRVVHVGGRRVAAGPGLLRGRLGDLLSCRWCAGWWISGVVLAAWSAHADTLTSDRAVPLALEWAAIAGAAGALAHLDPDTDATPA